jgi:hypothetical protein
MADCKINIEYFLELMAKVRFIIEISVKMTLVVSIFYKVDFLMTLQNRLKALILGLFKGKRGSEETGKVKY